MQVSIGCDPMGPTIPWPHHGAFVEAGSSTSETETPVGYAAPLWTASSPAP